MQGQMFPPMMAPPLGAPYGQHIMQPSGAGASLSSSLFGNGPAKPNIIINSQDQSVNARLKIASDYINSGDNQAAEQILNELIYNGHIIISYDQPQPPVMMAQSHYGGLPGQKYAPYNPMEAYEHQEAQNNSEMHDKMF